MDTPEQNLIRYGLIFLFLSFLAGNVYSQSYVKKISKDSISISYKWQKEKPLRKESPYVLVLKIKNNSESKVIVSFVVLYYWKAQLNSTSDKKHYCLKPGQVIKGRRWNLAFKADFIVMDEYLDPLFNWEISRLNVRKNDECKSGLKLRLEPAYQR